MTGPARPAGASPRWSDVALRTFLSALPRRLRFRALAEYWKRSRRDRRVARRRLPGGIELELDLGDWVCAHLFYLGRYEPDTLAWLRRACRPGDVVVEAGAHVGYFTVWCARFVGPSGSVHAFEPWPPSRSLLERNVERNRASNVVVSPAALSRREGRARLGLENPSNDGTAWLSPESSGRGEVVETTTLDAYAERLGMERIDVIKIDVQGHELDVVEGMGGVLEANPGARVLVELDEALLARSGADRERVVEALRARGFEPAALPDARRAGAGRPVLVEFSGPDR